MLSYHMFPAIVAGVAMLMDLRSGKADNGWILFSMAAGFCMLLLEKGPAAIPDFALGAVLPLFLLGGLFLFGMLGAGDIKLFCVLGSVMGMEAVLKCIFLSMFTGACISFAILKSEGNFCHRFHYFLGYVKETVTTQQILPYSKRDISSPECFHFTVPIFLSAVLYAGGVY